MDFWPPLNTMHVGNASLITGLAYYTYNINMLTNSLNKMIS